MADLRPFHALRYDVAIAGDPAMLVAPPYDVVSEADQLALYARSPYNVSHVDYAESLPGDRNGDRYSRARQTLDAWRSQGVLETDPQARLYVYDQEFELRGQRLRRRAVFGRLRLEEWDKGIVLPHEATGAAAKEDRLRLLRATNVHLSPVLALYRPGVAPTLPEAALGAPVLDADLPDQRHVLRPIANEAAEEFSAALSDQRLYIADGHHRYETSLNYRNERRAAASTWTGDEPQNFILAAVVDAADPGLVVLPTHRLIRLPVREMRISLRRLWAFELEDAGVAGESGLGRLLARLAEAGRSGPAFGVVGLEEGRLHLLRPRDTEALLARMTSVPPELRRLDVNVLQHAVFPAIQFEESPDNIDYSEDYRHAAQAVLSGGWDVAFLLNPTPLEQVFAAADAGRRLPRKSTFFFPKLATGVVMLPLDQA